jgi:hypothetical protein
VTRGKQAHRFQELEKERKKRIRVEREKATLSHYLTVPRTRVEARPRPQPPESIQAHETIRAPRNQTRTSNQASRDERRPESRRWRRWRWTSRSPRRCPHPATSLRRRREGAEARGFGGTTSSTSTTWNSQSGRRTRTSAASRPGAMNSTAEVTHHADLL